MDFFHDGTGKNVIIFGVDISLSTKIGNWKKDVLILGKDPTQESNIPWVQKIMYAINFTDNNKNVCLSLHYNGANSYLFVIGAEIHEFKGKDSETVATQLCLGNVSKTGQ